VAYWYSDNGNFTKLERKDELSNKLRYTYSYQAANNRLSIVGYSQVAFLLNEVEGLSEEII